MFDTTLMDMSSHMSCKHMKSLAETESNNFHNNFINQFTRTTITCHCDNPIRVPSIRIDKNNCMTKKNDYGDGDWIKQFQPLLEDTIENSFDVQTKIK